MSVWDLCTLDPETEALVNSLVQSTPDENPFAYQNLHQDEDEDEIAAAPEDQSDVGTYLRALQDAEGSCKRFMSELDSIIHTMDAVGTGFNDVTGRTNSLMLNCEALLEQQALLESTVDKLRTSLQPFDDVELISAQLGIPIDARSSSDVLGASRSPALNNGNGGGGGMMNVRGGVVNDPRSPEFKGILVRLREALRYLQVHPDFMDASKYRHWLVQLRGRAFSLVARTMRTLLESAARSAAAGAGEGGTDSSGRPNAAALTALATKMLTEDVPIESATLYRKFRGLGLRMKELQMLLAHGTAATDASVSASASAPESEVALAEEEEDAAQGEAATNEALEDVKQMYVGLRQQLLLPFMRELSIARPVKPVKTGGKNEQAAAGAAVAGSTDTEVGTRLKLTLPGKSEELYLCAGIHHAYGLLLRVCQLEHQLFDTLFFANAAAAAAAPPAPVDSEQQSSSVTTAVATAKVAVAPKEVSKIVSELCSAVCDGLRPLIIRESSVDELGRVAGALADDVRSQIASLALPSDVLATLEQGVERTVRDTQERLSYCAEMRLRHEVQRYVPQPELLVYPDVLEKAREQSAAAAKATATSNPDASFEGDALLAARTWYPPLRSTLALLSKLYGVVEPVVFEDFARRAVRQCVVSVQAAAEKVVRTRPTLHGELFLVRSLLILREQLMPFDTRMVGTERKLDFSNTGAALTHFAANARNVLRSGGLNSLWQLAREGLPQMTEQGVDAKRELDEVLKSACGTLKEGATRLLLGALDAWLLKAAACTGGDIPVVHDNLPAGGGGLSGGAGSVDVTGLLTAEHVKMLRAQAFMKPKRVLEVLHEAKKTATENMRELRNMMCLYVQSSVARTVLLKPVQQEVELMRRRMVTLVVSCVDHGQERRDIEALAEDVTTKLCTELAQCN